MDYIIRKERGVYTTFPQMTAALDAAQLEKFEEDFKAYGVNQTVHDSLKPFLVRVQFTSASDGTVSFASDYMHLLAGVFTVTGSTVNKMRFINPDELPDALTNQLRAVSTSSPIATDTDLGFQIYPQSQQVGFYSYLRRPATPVFDYTQVGRVITYNSSGSTQLEWQDNYIDNIIARALSYLGINMDDEKIQVFAEQQKNETK
jgi:hypothetical protein